MKYTISKIIALLLVVAGFASCDSGQECYEPVDVRSNIRFSTERLTTIILDSVSGSPRDSIVVGFFDTTLLNSRISLIDVERPIIFPSSNTGSIYPLLNPDTNVQRYSIQFDSTIARFDTFTLFYKTNLHFISNACGYTFFYNLDSVRHTSNVIDSMWIRDFVVGNDANAINVSFYFFNR